MRKHSKLSWLTHTGEKLLKRKIARAKIAGAMWSHSSRKGLAEGGTANSLWRIGICTVLAVRLPYANPDSAGDVALISQ